MIINLLSRALRFSVFNDSRMEERDFLSSLQRIGALLSRQESIGQFG